MSQACISRLGIIYKALLVLDLPHDLKCLWYLYKHTVIEGCF